jgi:4-amino-4-deoxy-L-arabinose transferase-like glycosyltransferase
MMQQPRLLTIEFFLVTLAACSYMAWFALPLLAAGTTDARMVAAFYIDEHISLSAIQQTLAADTLLLQHRSYGHIFLNIVLLPLYLVNQFAPVTAQQITIALRVVSALFGAATLVATFVLARRTLGSPVAWGAVVLLAVLPISFLRYATLARADVVQVFFLVLAIYCGCRLAEDGQPKWLTWASVAAGFAFAAKYSGLFVLPVLWMVVVALVYTGKTARPSAARVNAFINLTRIGVAVAGVVSLFGAVLFAPEFVARYLTVDGTIEYAADLVILQQLRLLAAVGGGVLLILAGLPMLWNWLRTHSAFTTPLSSITTQVVRSGVVFGLAFALTAPASLWQFDFIRAFVFQSRSKTFGLHFADDRGGLYWIELLASEALLSWLLLGLLLVSLVWLLYAATQLKWHVLLHPIGIIWSWTAIHMGLLLVAIRYFVPHFVLPALPFLIILALHPISLLAGFVTRRTSQRVGLALASGLVLVVLAIELPAAIPDMQQYQQRQIAKDHDARVQVGRWLTEYYPDSTRIAYDIVAYVPAQFRTAEVISAALAQKMQQENPPEVVVVSNAVARMYADPQRADTYFEGAEEFLQLHAVYTSLREERLGYTLVYAEGPYRVYEYRGS